MKKNTTRLIVTITILMFLGNGFLFYQLWNSNAFSNRRNAKEVNEFIIKELNLSPKQQVLFLEAADQHHTTQIEISHKYKNVKHQLNHAMMEDKKILADSLMSELSATVIEKELEMYRFLNELTSFTTDLQKSKLGEVFKEATGAPHHAQKSLEPIARNLSRPTR